jgi:hypothetical protein
MVDLLECLPCGQIWKVRWSERKRMSGGDYGGFVTTFSCPACGEGGKMGDVIIKKYYVAQIGEKPKVL